MTTPTQPQTMTMTEAGRVTMATSIKARNMFLVVGSGTGWTGTPPAMNGGEESLEAAFGVTKARLVQYVYPDEAGDVRMADGTRWTVTATPTKHLYCEFQLDFEDSPNETVREMAVYLGSQFASSVPAGATYAPIGNVQSVGQFLAMKNTVPRERLGAEITLGEVLTF